MLRSAPVSDNGSFRAMTVVILGRPNVGKSTLFNRLCNVRQAITHAGVTRDLGYGTWDLGGIEVTLVDSGGVMTERDTEDSLTGQVSERSFAAADAADVVLLVVDVEGPTATDYELATNLRRRGQEPIVVVNKADHSAREAEAARFHELGFRDLVAISAAHGRGINTLITVTRTRIENSMTQTKSSITAEPQSPSSQESVVRLALLGRPNTGKSTLLNSLTGRSLALVDSIPGTTRDPVSGGFYASGVRFEVIDTAGLRRRARVNAPVEYYSTQRSVAALERSDVTVLLADAQSEIADQEKRLASLAVRRGTGLVVALNKWDLCRGQDKQSVTDRARYHLPALAYVPLVTLSALEGTGLADLLDACVSVSEQRARMVSTSQINDAVQRWNRLPGAAGSLPRIAPKGRPLRVQYGVQTSSNPVRLLFFVNRPQVPAHFRRFLENKVRSDLGFDRIPIIIDIRSSPATGHEGRQERGRR